METLNYYLQLFFAHQINIKMYHFRTTNYGAHKAADSYLNKFNANFDRFMEAAQGIFGKVKLSKIGMEIITFEDETIQLGLKEFSDILEGMDNEFVDKSDLLAIRDEMLADVNQLKYLLTFK